MPTSLAHLAESRTNFKLYIEQRSALPPNWQAVLLFYSAVHLIEALAAVNNDHWTTHTDRNSFVRSLGDSKLWGDYSRLEQESRKARYMTISKLPTELAGNGWKQSRFSMTTEDIATHLVPAHERVRVFVEARISEINGVPLAEIGVKLLPAVHPVGGGGPTSS